MFGERVSVLLRVSTDQQAQSGLGIDAQKAAVAAKVAQERWEVVKRQINQTAKRDRPVLPAAPWHDNPQDLKTKTLDPKNIPYNELENSVLKAPPAEMQPWQVPEKPDLATENANLKSQVMANRLTTLEDKLDKVIGALEAKTPAPAPEAPQGFSCPKCEKPFKTEQAVKMHVGRFHKEKSK